MWLKYRNKSRIATREISAKTLKIIEQKHQFDLELYEYSKKMFYKAIAEQGDEFQQDLHNFQHLNSSAYGKFSVFTATSAVKFQKIIATWNT